LESKVRGREGDEEAGKAAPGKVAATIAVDLVGSASRAETASFPI
jgi:hypothetical protein